MENFSCFNKYLQLVFACLWRRIAIAGKSFLDFLVCSYHLLLLLENSFWIHLCYFLTVSVIGFSVLKILEPKNTMNRPGNLDLFFMSVSATTVSSMDTVAMEVFSNAQLLVLTVLMLGGGEVFTSMISLQLMRFKLKKQGDRKENGDLFPITNDLIESESIMKSNIREVKLKITGSKFKAVDLKYSSLRYLGFVVLGFQILVHLTGSALILLYFGIVPRARTVLRNKRIQILTFSVFTTVSSFTNCGFIPTNENMVVFKKDSLLLLLIISQILIGNTLFGPCLRFCLWVLRRITKREEFDYLLRNQSEIGYEHLLPAVDSVLLVITVLGFIAIQFILFCCLEWKSEVLGGLDPVQKIVGGLFLSVNSRHAGESVVDLSMLSPALLVLYIFMMYLSPYTSFKPIEKIYKNKNKNKRADLLKNLMLPQLSYLVIFTIMICITEQRRLIEDPLNFNVLNIVAEVIRINWVPYVCYSLKKGFYVTSSILLKIIVDLENIRSLFLKNTKAVGVLHHLDWPFHSSQDKGFIPIHGNSSASSYEKLEPLLCNVEPDIYEAHKGKLAPNLSKRAEHYFSENIRIMEGKKAWASGNLEDFGKLISASGLSSIQNYECGCEPLIQLYQILLRAPGMFGARFSGAGFRGCCIALVAANRAKNAAYYVEEEYRKVQPKLASLLEQGMAVLVCDSGTKAHVI